MRGMRHWSATTLRAAGLALLLLAAAPAGAQAPQDWRAEFEAVCSTTDASAAMSVAELTDLLVRCDKLAAAIASEAEETVRRVYARRLKLCRDLLAFVLESKGVTPPPPPVATPPPPAAPAAATPTNP